MAALFDGRRKVDDGIEPLAVRGPVITDGSVDWKDQLPPMSHELLEPLEFGPYENCVPLATARFPDRVLSERSKSNPVPGLSHAVHRSIVCWPGLLLSMNPLTALSHVMLLRTVMLP